MSSPNDPSSKPDYRRERYRKVYGLQDGEPEAKTAHSALFQLAIRSQAEVAEILGITRQAVHQAERRAIWKLRAAFRALTRASEEL